MNANNPIVLAAHAELAAATTSNPAAVPMLNLKLWEAIVDDLGDMKTAKRLKVAINRQKKFPDEPSVLKIFNEAEACWFAKTWNIDTHIALCECCGEIHNSFI